LEGQEYFHSTIAPPGSISLDSPFIKTIYIPRDATFSVEFVVGGPWPYECGYQVYEVNVDGTETLLSDDLETMRGSISSSAGQQPASQLLLQCTATNTIGDNTPIYGFERYAEEGKGRFEPDNEDGNIKTISEGHNTSSWPTLALWKQIRNGDRVFVDNSGVFIHFANIYYKYANNNTNEYRNKVLYLEMLPGIENTAWGNLLYGNLAKNGGTFNNSHILVEITLRNGISEDWNGDDIAPKFPQKIHLLPINVIGYYTSGGVYPIDVRQMNDIPFSDQISDDDISANNNASDYTFLIQNVDIISGNSRGGNTGWSGTTFICPPCITNDPEVFFESNPNTRELSLVGRYINVKTHDHQHTDSDTSHGFIRSYGHPEQLTNISSYHPQFGTMNGGNSIMDLSAIIHDVRQSQLTGWRHDGKNNLWNTHPQRATIYSLDLLALLNMTYDGDKWTHRLAPNPEKRVQFWHVTKSPITTSLDNMVIADGNKRDKIYTPILIISDIGKGWVDYEGTMMSRERYFRLCEVLGDPPDHYAIAMDDMGNSNKFHGDLDIKGKARGFYGKYFLDGAAPWDLSGSMASPDGSTTAGNFLDIPNKVQQLNNPIQHLYNGGYTTFDDPTTGAGCVGFPNANRLKSGSSKWNGGNNRKHFRLAFETTGERTLPITDGGKLTNDSSPGSYLFFPHWKNSNPTDQQDQYHSVEPDFTNAGYAPLDAMRMVHPSKYVFDPDLAGETHTTLKDQANDNAMGPWSFMESVTNIILGNNITRNVIDPSKYGIWVGGAKDRNIDGNYQTYISNYNSEPFTMEYIAYRYQPIIHGKHHNNDWRNWSTSFSSKTRSDKDNKFMDVTPSNKYYDSSNFARPDMKSQLSNDASLVWEDINGVSNFSQGDDFIDNSRYRWTGSNYYTKNGMVKPLFGKWRALWIGDKSTDNTFGHHYELSSQFLTSGGYDEHEYVNGIESAYGDVAPRQIGNTVNYFNEQGIQIASLLSSLYNSSSEETMPAGQQVAVPSLKNDCVGKPVSFHLNTTEEESQENWMTNTIDVPYRAWMTKENQKRYYDTIKFFSTKEDKFGDKTAQNKPERDENRQAPSETTQFKDNKTGIEGLE